MSDYRQNVFSSMLSNNIYKIKKLIFKKKKKGKTQHVKRSECCRVNTGEEIIK